MEFHVAETHRRQGIGRQMMEELVERGRASGLRIVVCETQNTNVPAIHFYRRVGFNIEGIDLSYYSNGRLARRRGGGLHEEKAGVTKSSILIGIGNSVRVVQLSSWLAGYAK